MTSPVVITGAGIDSNMTGYRLEFYSKDPIILNNYSSFSNGYVAGQLAFVANTHSTVVLILQEHLQEPKGLKMETGICVMDLAKVKPENIITDPLPVELTSFSAKIIGKTILLKWQTATGNK
ncbi:MAG: hypothetical protein IPJ23_00475 [Ignavibacteriales bacterium]|nr:hypothetical protein [Ignavibacteriales bacterium]